LQGLAGPLNDEQQKQLGMVKSSARHLLNMINRVNDMKKPILIIEDNGQTLYLLTFIPKKYGYDVVQARDGREGIELADRVLPILILLDIQLPVLDGYRDSSIYTPAEALRDARAGPSGASSAGTSLGRLAVSVDQTGNSFTREFGL
jgi:PleD family two-component response regulator